MPRWRALPDELDPQVREFAGQLRRLVDRSGLSIAAVADRTGYSKTSWERYLNGRLLAPKGAIVALAEVTGTDPVHLATMWELAERAWSRSEMRHDMTMEAIRISQARAALAETGGQSTAKARTKAKNGRASRSATATPGVAGPAGVSPTVPPQPRSPGSLGSPGSSGSPGGERISRSPSYGSSSAAPSTPSAPSSSSPSSSASSSASSLYGSGSGAGAAAGGAPRISWGVTPSSSSGTSGASGSSGPFGSSGPSGPSGVPSSVPSGPSARVAGGASAPSGVFGPPQGGGGRPDDGGSAPGRRLSMFLAGAVGALVVIAAAFFLTNGDGRNQAEEKPPTSPSTSPAANPDLPAGVKCSGQACNGKDPEAMGCIGDLVTTTATKFVGTVKVEVRYSETCQAAWARLTQGTQGDEVQVTVGRTKETAAIEAAGDNIAYTQMVTVKDADEATACATLATGQKGCTG
ncbi:helix-turn-helix domain-containing protein [Streptomyces ipomoeae]|uniref:helix-turn-helix domain-containing protein n=1 Tax=Streptomyces ipomoeae TaxID=103232 RepID=UPI0015F0E1B5|nr:XRE family transcriptional regulator [Streptomyces ipomoeae]